MMYGQLCTEFYDSEKKFAPAEEVEFYKTLFDTKDFLLEPMCGSGRFLIPMLQEGYAIHGVDNSPAMLKSCKKRAKNLGLDPTLFEKNIENMSLPTKYNGIVIPLGSFQLLSPRSLAFHVLQNLKNHLLPGGKLILDLFIPWDALSREGENDFSERETKVSDGSIIRLKSHDHANKYEQYYISKTTYEKIADGKIIATENCQMTVCWYYRYEMELILEKCGFKNIVCRERELNFHHSIHMTFIAEN